MDTEHISGTAEPRTESAADGEAPEAAAAAPDPAAAALDELLAERDLLAAEKADLLDRLLRRQAEFENFRRRSEQDRMRFFEFAGMEIVRELLPVVDDFERALKIECADKDYVRGVELIYQRLADTLKKAGLEPIETVGRTFDPNFHQAVDRVETGDVEDHAILAEYQRGFNFKGRLLRPSMVQVAVKPS
jgi:molecular chaperone GrpE